MKPPMNQSITILQPILDAQLKDPYGRPSTARETVKARVQYATRMIRGTDGQTYETNLEVDLPAEAKIKVGHEIEYIDLFGQTTKGKVIAMNESTNLAGNKVYFRTVYVG